MKATFLCVIMLKLIDFFGEIGYHIGRHMVPVQLCQEGVLFMFNKEVIVRCESGLHNRQATYFVQKANDFESSIWLESASRKMNAKSLLGIMSLGIITGATVTISAMGPDAEEAVNALEALLQRDVY